MTDERTFFRPTIPEVAMTQNIFDVLIAGFGDRIEQLSGEYHAKHASLRICILKDIVAAIAHAKWEMENAECKETP